jgi:hypothetical protein
VAPRAQRQRLTARAARAVLVLASSLAAGCSAPGCDVHIERNRVPDPTDAISVTWTLDPSPPVVGTPIVARVTLRDREQKPLNGARLRLEGLMSHAGMAPVMAALSPHGEGVYEAPLQFTMAGDWILLVTGELADGSPVKKQIEVAGVRPSS